MGCQRIAATGFAVIGLAAAAAAPPSVDRIGPEPAEAAGGPYRFSPEEQRLLDAVERAAFDYFWHEIGRPALRAFRRLRDDRGRPLVWRADRARHYGFADAFNLDQHYVSRDYVGIDQGAMLLAIENARTGLIWKLFMRHPAIRGGLARLKLPVPGTDAATQRETAR